MSAVVGFIETFKSITNREDYCCCAWEISDIIPMISQDLKSPIFTVTNRKSECKLFLSLQSSYENASKKDFIFSGHLNLDCEQNDCEEVVAKFNLTALKLGQEYESESNLESFRTFIFDSKSKKSVGSFFLLSKDELDVEVFESGDITHTLQIMCEIMIERVFPKNYNKLSTDFGILLNKQLLSDVILSVGGKEFPAHKTILAARSSVFAAMFAHDMAENRGTVNIKDIDEEVVQEMLRFIYTDEVEKFEDLVSDLLIAADKYNLKGLQNKCKNFLIKALLSSNVFDILLLAESCNAKILKSEAIGFIATKSTQLMKTSAWDNICQSSPQLLQEIAKALVLSKLTTPESK